ncbi:MAG: cytochrome c oxidase subunit 3 [Gammaproteobacteria bacterium]|jgi:cytochrome c oxidase subunit 3|nr:cytochrome c oxidase subunit 3 [Gammaproteobacteria bacterium]MDP6732602.1 cytochrome c oxidase subunit 3 [Gammaproteobacteria bacterium]|tara:strand:+ start:1506 stop:2120 length:615 start_codon:yes stop_codon:yes gene_type:complete
MSLTKALTTKPWERKGVIGGLKPEGAFDAPSEKVALIFFLIVATIVFSLFAVSYFVRMELPDWQPLSEPAQLWFNTILLIISSAMFQWARNIVSRDSLRSLTPALIGGGVFAILFIIGQLITWGNLQSEGYYLASNPANSFYYLLTGLHGVHLLGGLWVWSKSSIRLISGGEPKEIKLSIELCTVYWHFLLVVWLVLFAILSNT